MSGPCIGEVRPSQVITSFGPGAIVDLQTLSIIVASTASWNEAEAPVIREHRLERALGVAQFLSAPPLRGSAFNPKGTVPAFIFPRFHHCPVCKTISEVGVGDPPDAIYEPKEGAILCKTPGCKGVKRARGVGHAHMVPAPFIVACPSGHLDEFPWQQYVHRGQNPCRGRLQLTSNGDTGTIADLWVSCSCKARRSMSDAFGETAVDHIGGCGCGTPWVRPGAREIRCDTPRNARTLQRGATNGWFPVVKSALKIGVSADPVAAAIQRCDERQIEKIKTLENLSLMMSLDMFAPLQGLEPEVVWRKLQELRGEVAPAEEDIRIPEWAALHDLVRYSAPSGELLLEQGEVPSFAKQLLENVVLVRKLSEVRALTGFTRVDHLSGIADSGLPEKMMPVYPRNRRPNWLPATEVRGEGIFITLNEKALAQWEGTPEVARRAQSMAAKHAEWERDRKRPPSPFPGARFVLLHTLAHALIRQISLDCGYPASSVRERIYSSTDPGQLMAGILIYTASPDSEGSLGGLVDLGQSSRLPDLLRAALQEATRCSSDPLCADHEPDAHASINGAACHACQLVSETSCEAFNLFLDRNMLVPTLAGSSLAFFPDPGMP